MEKVAPSPRWLLTSMQPPLNFTIPYTVDSPRPVPLPSALVVKNGSKIWSSTAGEIPLPLSFTVSLTLKPGVTSGKRDASSDPIIWLLVLTSMLTS